jgi:long-chain acyl-CoA synthetase
VVVGDRRPFIACLITLDADMLGTWLATHGRPDMPPAEAAQDPYVRTELQSAIDAANAAVSRAEGIKKFTVLPFDLTEASGHLSAKQSLRRQVVLRDLAATIDELYA